MKHSPRAPARLPGAYASIVLLCAACTPHFLSGVAYPKRDWPVARIETRGGVEYGATTEAGVLFLGRTASTGPCRVHYFLGDQLVVEDGAIEALGTTLHRARIDLKHHNAPLWYRDLGSDDPLVALVLYGESVDEVAVRKASREFVTGDVLDDPGVSLPLGTPLFRTADDGTRCFAGLVAGSAAIERGGRTERYVVFAGIDRLRELLLQPEPHPRVLEVDFRPDGIRVERAVAPVTASEKR